MRSKTHAKRGPLLEVRAHVDAARGPLVLADGPVLLEGTRALDRRLVGALVLVEVVIGPILGEAAFELGAVAWIVGPVVLDNVVLAGGWLVCDAGMLWGETYIRGLWVQP